MKICYKANAHNFIFQIAKNRIKIFFGQRISGLLKLNKIYHSDEHSLKFINLFLLEIQEYLKT